MSVSKSSFERLFDLLDLVEEPHVGRKNRRLVLLLGDYFPEGNGGDEEGISYKDMLLLVNLAGCSREEALQFNDLVKEAGGLDKNQGAYLIRVLGRSRSTVW